MKNNNLVERLKGLGATKIHGIQFQGRVVSLDDSFGTTVLRYVSVLDGEERVEAELLDSRVSLEHEEETFVFEGARYTLRSKQYQEQIVRFPNHTYSSKIRINDF